GDAGPVLESRSGFWGSPTDRPVVGFRSASPEPTRLRAVPERKGGLLPLRRGEAEVLPGRGRGQPPSRTAQHVALPDEVGLGHRLDGVTLLADGDGEGGQADGPPTETAAQGVEDGPVEAVETDLVDVEEGQ